MKVNFKAAVNEFPVLDPQTVEAEFVKAEIKTTASGKNAGAKYASFDFLRDDGDDVENANMHFFQNYSLLPQSLWALRQTLDALNCDPDVLNDEDAEVEDAISSVLHNRCALKIGIEDYPSKERDEKGEPVIKQRNNILAVMKV